MAWARIFWPIKKHVYSLLNICFLYFSCETLNETLTASRSEKTSIPVPLPYASPSPREWFGQRYLNIQQKTWIVGVSYSSDKNCDQKKVGIVRVEFCNALLRSKWGMQIKEANGNTVRLSVVSSHQATAGCYSVRVETKSKDSFGETSLYQLKNGQQICFVEENWDKLGS